MNATIYLNPTANQVLLWLRSGLCAFCGSKCGSGSCRLRYCDSCSRWWVADTEADWDFGYPEAKEDCPPCVEWFANLHLENPALNADGVGLNAFRRKYVTSEEQAVA